MADSFILPMNTTEDALELIGGKGRSLAKMSNAGFDVPGGFHLNADAYRAFINQNNLQDQIVALAKPALDNGWPTFEPASAAIQELITSCEVSAEVASQLRETYASLGAEPAVAVRSSANAEDLPGLSFAGQQETYLNVKGGDALVVAVRNCWASLWTAQAISYRHENEIDQGSVAMAVVVQIMVPAEVAGIMFTANPATGDRTEMIINASFGLGEAVVGGQVTPDTFIVDRPSKTIKETMIGPKEQMIVSDGDQGTKLTEVEAANRDQSSLSDGLLNDLVELALKIEKTYDGVPQDIEWAIVDGRISLLQSRPITNLPPQPLEVEWQPPEEIPALVRRQIVENIPDPTCELFDELYIRRALRWDRTKEISNYATLNGFAFQIMGGGNITETKEQWRANIRKAREKVAATPEGMAQEKHDLELFLSELSDDDRAAFQKMADELDSDNLPNAVTVPESDDPTFTAFHKTFTNDNQHRDWRERAMPELEAATNKWAALDIASASDATLMEGIRELTEAEGWYWAGNGGHTFGVAKSVDDQLQCFLRENLPEHRFTSGQFLSGFKSRIMQANDALFEIARVIRANDELGLLILATPARRLMRELEARSDTRQILGDIDAYLQEYGHQGYSLDFCEPTQQEDPSALFVTLKNMVRRKDYDPKQHEEEARRKKEKALKDISELLDGLKYWQFRYRLWFANKYYPMREESCFVLGMAWPVLRPMAAELGRRMVEVGTFKRADDVYHMYSAELDEAMQLRADHKGKPELGELAEQRRELRERRKRLHPPGTCPPEASELPGIAFKETQIKNDDTSDTLMGIPVSPGTVTAEASVIMNPSEFSNMIPGSILVCPMTSPAWTQLFAHAQGLVTDIGGILGHGSIVAREYGIPAVVGTGNCTQRIKHGQMIEVDGDGGTVRLLEGE
ncbi:MAG: PEP-utilizing enzyme [Proteobacteria bacterium]|jgi:phosphohistidine swiveling domain-containing protein|nr:PEP-utilizing enzyme [Pseudomonadota bacterium]MDA1300488.1 PEP-utilizing enzyme [Pseudomonadota bacterium]